MEPKTRRILCNICFFLMIASLLGIAVALRYSYEFDPDPVIRICYRVGLISAVVYIVLHRIKSE